MLGNELQSTDRLQMLLTAEPLDKYLDGHLGYRVTFCTFMILQFDPK